MSLLSVDAFALYGQSWAAVVDACKARNMYILVLYRKICCPLVCAAPDLSSFSHGHKPQGRCPAFHILQMGTERL